MNKKYYWLKIKEDWFEDDTIDWIEDQPNGEKYSLFYIKLCLKSLRSNGILIRVVGDVLIPYDAPKLAEMTKTDVDTVRVAMELFQKIGLIQILENGEIYLTQLNEMVGSETDKAQLMRKKRAMEKIDSNIVTNVLPNCYLDIDIDKDIYVFKTKDKDFVVKESDLQRYKDVYPFVDVEQELKKMGLWLDSNVSKRKTHKGMPRFINNWLNNCKPKEMPSYIDEIPEI